MRKDIHKKGEPKARYRVRNWAAYNEGLINRGDVTIWIDGRCCINRARSVDVYAQWSRGQPPIKSDSRVTA
ncbi:MAG: hypothetical protein E5299_02116 [Burkholderia gladioli]|nr:MAG: hypothetical protein E5299_02116 [Burkholderia gladioli]